MKNFKLLAFVVLGAAIGFAASEPIVEVVSTLRPTWFQSGIYIGPPQFSITGETNNKIAKVQTVAVDYAFGQAAASTCQVSTGRRIAIPGVASQDICIVSSNLGPRLGADGGAAAIGSAFNCALLADGGLEIRRCAEQQDEAPDAGYIITVISRGY